MDQSFQGWVFLFLRNNKGTRRNKKQAQYKVAGCAHTQGEATPGAAAPGREAQSRGHKLRLWPLALRAWALPEHQDSRVQLVTLRWSLSRSLEPGQQGRAGRSPELDPGQQRPLPGTPAATTWPLGLVLERQRRPPLLMCGKAMKRKPLLAQTFKQELH